MNFIFFCIYNTQYLDGKNKANNSPWFTALGLMISGSICWFLAISEIFYFYLLNQDLPKSSTAIDCLVCCFISYVHYLMFIKDKKYEEIYERFKSSAVNNRKTNITVSSLYILFPIIIGTSLAMKWHHTI